VSKAFVRLRSGLPAVTPDRQAAYAAAAAQQYHTFRGVPEEAWPIFLSAKQYLHMLDGGCWAGGRGEVRASVVHQCMGEEMGGCDVCVCVCVCGVGGGARGVQIDRLAPVLLHQAAQPGMPYATAPIHPPQPPCPCCRPSGTLRKPFFRRHPDGSFLYESGGRGGRLRPPCWSHQYCILKQRLVA
jgi:hypothetical protein